MHWYWYVILAFTSILILFILSEIKIRLTINKQKNNDFIEIKVWIFYNLIRITKKIPIIAFESVNEGIKYKSETNKPGNNTEKKDRITKKKVINWRKQFKQIVHHIHDFYIILKKFVKKIRIDVYKWETIVGTGDAMDTGLISGLLWGIKGSTLGIVSNYAQLHTNPIISVSPEFNKQIYTSRFECILRFRVGYLIITGIRLIVKLFQGGRKKWQKNILSKA